MTYLLPFGLRYIYNFFLYRRCYPHAFIDERSSISKKTNIEEGVIINSYVSITSNCCKLGKCSNLMSSVTIRGSGKVDIGNYCIIAPYVFFISEDHNFRRKYIYPHLQNTYGTTSDDPRCADDYIYDDILVGDDTWVGARATILKGAHIGKGSVVAAGAVVTKGVYPDYAILAGVPAKVISSRKEYINQ